MFFSAMGAKSSVVPQRDSFKNIMRETNDGFSGFVFLCFHILPVRPSNVPKQVYV